MKKEMNLYLEEMPDEALLDYVTEKTGQKFRFNQLKRYLIQGVLAIDDMTSLPASLREQLKQDFKFGTVTVEKEYRSSIDDTVKFLFRLHDGNCIEGVLMKYLHGYSVCISSQAGCKMGCKFCASSDVRFSRDLTAYEMLRQVYLMQKTAGDRIGNIVVMGIGEPFDNYDNLILFLKTVHDPEGFNVGYRKITVSTCGIVPKIRQFAEENMPVNLSVSLHAPNDDIRKTVMPVANRWTVDEIIKACRYYVNKTGRRVTFEYALIEGVNSDKKQAYELVRLLKGLLCHVNLIPVNSIRQTAYSKPNPETVKTFQNIITNAKIPVSVRRELGSDIQAACGQLRKTEMRE
jgi:23S rRNA (adenine2503-C2)-methyltransferase